MRKKHAKGPMRDPREIEEALSRLAPLSGVAVVDAARATLRWVLRQAEWREVWTELAERYGTEEDAPTEAPGASHEDNATRS